ncbi:NADH-quinone oxidoreductase subunit NuoE [Streptomyces albospinus]|nr:NADH-quinone oxidoreductase subunit NuoE [Streptomyces albospinus]
MPRLPAPDYPADVRARLEADAKEVIARYPGSRSALLPLLHLVQAEEGHITRTGIRFCAEMLDLTTAEVTAVSTFYSMYRRTPSGDYQVGVCTNTLCAVMGGDAIFEDLKHHLGIGNGETTEDGAITLEHIECNAACDFAPVVMVNWEFFDNQTPRSARQLVDDLRAGRTVEPTRGAPLCTFKETARMLAGFPDRRPGAVEATGGAGPASLIGLRLAKGEVAPGHADHVVSPRTTADGPPDEAGPSPAASPDGGVPPRRDDAAGPADEEGK